MWSPGWPARAGAAVLGRHGASRGSAVLVAVWCARSSARGSLGWEGCGESLNQCGGGGSGRGGARWEGVTSHWPWPGPADPRLPASRIAAPQTRRRPPSRSLVARPAIAPSKQAGRRRGWSPAAALTAGGSSSSPPSCAPPTYWHRWRLEAATVVYRPKPIHATIDRAASWLESGGQAHRPTSAPPMAHPPPATSHTRAPPDYTRTGLTLKTKPNRKLSVFVCFFR